MYRIPIERLYIILIRLTFPSHFHFPNQTKRMSILGVPDSDDDDDDDDVCGETIKSTKRCWSNNGQFIAMCDIGTFTLEDKCFIL